MSAAVPQLKNQDDGIYLNSDSTEMRGIWIFACQVALPHLEVVSPSSPLATVQGSIIERLENTCRM